MRPVTENKTGEIMKPSKKQNGYMQINLWTRDGRRKKEHVHRLMALTFIPNPENLPQVNHIDRIRDNNVLSNLEWVSSKENVAKSSHPVRIHVYKVNKEYVGCFESIRKASESLGLIEANVSMCLHGKQKKHKGYVFEPA